MVGENNNWKNISRAIPRQNHQVRDVYFQDVKPPSNMKQAPRIIFKNSKFTEPTALESGLVEAIIHYQLLTCRDWSYLLSHVNTGKHGLMYTVTPL